jgi:hypothetical protein
MSTSTSISPTTKVPPEVCVTKELIQACFSAFYIAEANFKAKNHTIPLGLLEKLIERCRRFEIWSDKT